MIKIVCFYSVAIKYDVSEVTSRTLNIIYIYNYTYITNMYRPSRLKNEMFSTAQLFPIKIIKFMIPSIFGKQSRVQSKLQKAN